MKKGFLLAVLLATNIAAHEFRLPVNDQIHGHDFDVLDDIGWRVNLDATRYESQAHRLFLDRHTTDTENLSAFFLNKESFRASNVFQNCLVPYNTQYYNPYMRVITLSPRVQHSEEGLVLAFSADRDVFAERGRFGFRVKLPFKVVSMERTDVASRRDSQTEDVVRLNKNDATGTSLGFGYRLDFLEAMPNRDMVTEQVVYNSGGSGYVTIFGGDTRSNKAAAVYVPEGSVPRGTRVGVAQTAVSATSLPTKLESLSDSVLYSLGSGSYATLSDVAATNATVRAANQDKKATVWVVSTHDGSGDMPNDSASEKISTAMNDLMKTFNTNTYEWLADRGYTFESSRQMGIGDLEFSCFYNHNINDRATFGLSFLSKLPTAYGSQFNDDNYAGNPYRAHLGNGGHLEIGGGADLSVEAFSWLYWRVGAQYLFALQATEMRSATATGTLIKNVGPAEKADVSWQSMLGDIELQFCHPQTTDVSGLIGYQVYYKKADTVKFKNSVIEHWLGKTYSSSTKDFTVANSMTLDNDLAAARSEQWSHRIRLGLTYHFSDWLSVSMQSSFAIAGKNSPKSFEWALSCRTSV